MPAVVALLDENRDAHGPSYHRSAVKRIVLASVGLIVFLVFATWQIFLNVVGNYFTDIVPLAAARSLLADFGLLVLENLVGLLLVALVAVAVTTTMLWRRSGAPRHSRSAGAGAWTSSTGTRIAAA